MSREAVEAIIGKAVLDSEFRAALLADPDRALAGYDLTQEEVARLRAVDAESIETLAGALDERISKSTTMLSFGSLAPRQEGEIPVEPSRRPPSTGTEPVTPLPGPRHPRVVPTGGGGAEPPGPWPPMPPYDHPEPGTDPGGGGAWPPMPHPEPHPTPSSPTEAGITGEPNPPMPPYPEPRPSTGTDPLPPGHAYPVEPPDAPSDTA